MASLEQAYLVSDDPIAQSGFTGGSERWELERSPILEAVDRDGSLLDVGCANGRLAADLRRWSAARGLRLDIAGIDIGPRLIELARSTVDGGEFAVADAWSHRPDRRWTFVVSTLHLAPVDLWPEWVMRLRGWVEDRGRLILGHYGSRSQDEAPVDVAAALQAMGFDPAGSSAGGNPTMSRFAWLDVP